MLRCFLIAACVVWSVPSMAQRVITYDTVSTETGSAVTCAFCAGEKFGVIFRDLPPPARGLEATDFPFTLRGVRVAVANAFVDGVCTGSTASGTGEASLEVYAGTTLPSGSIQTNPETGPWEGETLLIEAVDVPLQRSALEMEGGLRYLLEFNDLQLLDPDTEEPIVVASPMTYVRVVFTFGEEADRNPVNCEGAGLVSPTSFPMRDADGLIANERNFIFGSGGLGWQWSEAVGVMGDWAIRMEIQSMGGGDAGLPDAAGMDAGAIDAGADSGADAAAGDSATADAGGGTSGGGCSTSGRSTQSTWVLLGLISLGRRRR